MFGSKLIMGSRFGSKLTTGSNFGHKLYTIGSIIKTGGEIYNKVNDIRSDLEKFNA